MHTIQTSFGGCYDNTGTECTLVSGTGPCEQVRQPSSCVMGGGTYNIVYKLLLKTMYPLGSHDKGFSHVVDVDVVPQP